MAKTTRISDPQLLASIRAAYVEDVQACAETLRPRFESGELRMCLDDDPKAGEPGDAGMRRLEDAIRDYFGLDITKTKDGEWVLVNGDHETAHTILAVSPSAEDLDDNWTHVCYWAVAAAAWDVLLYARAKGWSKPVRGEQLYRSRYEEEKRLAIN
jgi:hypothetical protein